MKILYLHQYFLTNSSNGGTRSYEFAKYLSDNGYKVNVITGTECEKKYDELQDGLYVYSTSTKYNNKMSKWRRIIAFFDYIIKALIKGLKTKNIDIVFATSTPLTIGIPAVLLAKLLRKKLIFEVRDVWPDVPIQLGFINNKFAAKFLTKLEFWIYKNSKHIIVLSEGMYQNLIKKGIQAEKLSIIENMSNLYLYDNVKNKYRDSVLEGKFVCIHPGTMGHVNGLDFVLDVAKEIIELDNDILFLLIGEGNRKEHLIKRVKEENLTNVLINDALPKEEIVTEIKSSDLGIMCVDNKYKILEDNSANKFFDFLAAGLPILINYGGWQKQVLEETNCGRSKITPQEMATTILELKRNQKLRDEMSNNSRELAENKYSDTIAKKKLLTIIKNI
ncbi:glycosyltransferase family 4 protein [Neobacillus drentensis]|uniref:glycosyltransferase family 4 protein n=1 Tax=Neobacillus drentensis TaxID=220684 RepID=UPI002FFFCF2D